MRWDLSSDRYDLPLAQAVALSYSSPVFVTIGAVLLLVETVRLRRWLAVLAGCVGVLVIVRPWSHSFSAGVLVAVAAAMLGALVAIQIKQLSRVDPADTIVFYTYLFWVPISLLPALLMAISIISLMQYRLDRDRPPDRQPGGPR